MLFSQGIFWRAPDRDSIGISGCIVGFENIIGRAREKDAVPILEELIVPDIVIRSFVDIYACTFVFVTYVSLLHYSLLTFSGLSRPCRQLRGFL